MIRNKQTQFNNNYFFSKQTNKNLKNNRNKKTYTLTVTVISSAISFSTKSKLEISTPAF